MPQILLSGYFREELEQRIRGKGPPGKPSRVLFSCTYRKQPAWWMARPGRPMEVFQGLPWCTSGWDFPSNTGGEDSIPGQGAGIPQAVGQVGWCAATSEPAATTRKILQSHHSAHRNGRSLKITQLISSGDGTVTQSIQLQAHSF